MPLEGTVKWTNRWGGYSYISDIEVKEDGGTPEDSFRVLKRHLQSG